MTTATHPNIIDTIWSTKKDQNILRNILLILAGTALIAIAARIQVPMYPVPVTMQSFAVLLVGMAYGWRLGGLTLAAYIAEGAAGLPVFATGAGFAYLTGPTAGYLFGFVGAAMIVGWFAEKGWDRSFVKIFAAAIIGSLAIYAAGVSWLSYFVGFGKAVEVGMLPFLLGDMAKALLATTTLPIAWKFMK